MRPTGIPLSTAALVWLGAARIASADVCWSWSYQTEAGTFRTTGELDDGMASPGDYDILDMSVSSSAFFQGDGSLAGGEFVETQPVQSFTWDGSEATEWMRANGLFTNGSNFFTAFDSAQDLAFRFSPGSFLVSNGIGDVVFVSDTLPLLAPTPCVTTPDALGVEVSDGRGLIGAEGRDRARVQPGRPPVAMLKLASGSVVTFRELAAGRVGVAEVAPRGSPAWTDLLVRRWNPTPLEMFQALAPGAEVPELLVSDHRAATAAEPRSLTLPPLEGVPIDLFDCDPGEDFEKDWEATYAGVTQVVVSEVYEPFPWQEFAWYPGYAAYLGINNNLTTHFGICSGDWDGSYSVQVERRVSPGNWVNDVWAGLSYGARLTFHSNVPAIYRMRLLEGGPLSLLSAGAAYTPNPPVTD